MQIIEKSIDEIIPYAQNPRCNDEAVDAVASSIAEFGFQVPCVIDCHNILITGHTRLKAAKKLGLKTIPCICAETLTPAQVKAYRLADNKVSELATWDMSLLESELAQLDDLQFDMTPYGFDEIPDDECSDNSDDLPEIESDTEPVCKHGDVWQLGRHRLMCGDATSYDDVQTLTQGRSIDLCLTDPPYGISVVGADKTVGNKNFGIVAHGAYKPVIADDSTETARIAYLVVKEIAEKLILWGGNYFLDFLPASDSWLIWDKRCDSGIVNTYADGEMAWCSFHTPVRIYHQLWNGMIREGEHDKRVHPTQKPIKMLSDILRDFTERDATVLDVFGGSGSTLIACEQTERQCYIMELDPHYCDVIIKRWETETGLEATRA